MVQLIAAMTRRPCGSWNDVPPRLRRHFATVHCTVPDDQLLDHIFTTLAASHFDDERRGFTADVRQVVARLVPLTRALWYNTKVRNNQALIISLEQRSHHSSRLILSRMN